MTLLVRLWDLKAPVDLILRASLRIANFTGYILDTELSNNRSSEAEFKEFEPWLKFQTRLKFGWFHLKLYSMFHDLSRRSIETGFWRI